MVMDDPTTRMDLQSDAKAHTRPSSNVASIVAVVAPSALTIVGVGTVDNTEPHMHDGENKRDGTSESSKKRKKPVFLEGVELVDLDDCDISNRRLQCDSEDTDDEKASNREDMDVVVGAPSCVQTIWPSSSTTLAQVSPVVPVQTDPFIESCGGFPDPLFNAAGKVPHSDAIIMK